MENTLQAARADGGAQFDGRRIELTASGKVVVMAVIAGAAFVGWSVYQRYGAAEPAAVSARHAVLAHEQRAAAPTNTAVVASEPEHAGPSANTSSLASANAPSLAQMTQMLLKERADHNVQTAAWRTVNDANRQQLANLAASLQSLEAKVGALQRAAQATPAARVPREAVAEAAASAKNLSKAADTAKAATDVDVGSLPVESVSAQALGVGSFGNGVVEIGGQKLTAGQLFQAGETIVAIDPVSRSIVTNRRILNVTN
ncbi:hypothetical protein [Trinickia fusca]|uniref:Uncharacterized protein n=1 Tax=Trinickia fusca TaxID=2419777 RepID=A0A494X9U8_9BURK|nr:hypothetical protein [Trinickia fusca]RKP47547.1 hypothetical protein D7S89_15070 [Trinickia fusca]